MGVRGSFDVIPSKVLNRKDAKGAKSAQRAFGFLCFVFFFAFFAPLRLDIFYANTHK
jgi:hypothetical protein